MSISYDDFERKMLGGNAAPADSYQDFESRMLSRQPEFTPEESKHYLQDLKPDPANRRTYRPQMVKIHVAQMKQDYPELQNLSDEQIMDIYQERVSHRGRLVAQSAAKGVAQIADTPQALASLATLGNYQPDEYPSQILERKLREKDIVDLSKEKPLSPSEKTIAKGVEWGAGALGGGPAGAGIRGALTPVVAGTKAIPYLGAATKGAQSIASGLVGGTSSGKQLAKQTGLATGLGATAGALEGYGGINPNAASMVSLAPFAGGIAKGLMGVPKGVKSLNPIAAGEREALSDLAEQTRLTKEIPKTFGNIPSEHNFEQTGKKLRDTQAKKIEQLEEKRQQVAGPKYTQLKDIHTPFKAKHTVDFIKNTTKMLDPSDPLNKTAAKIQSHLELPSKESSILGPTGKKVVNPENLTISQAEKKIRLFNNEKSKAYKKGDIDQYRLYKATIQNLEKDLEAFPEVMKARKTYAELSKEPNEIRKAFKGVLKKEDFNQGYTVLDSEVPKKLVKLGKSGVSSQQKLYDIVKDNPETVGQIRAYNLKNMWDAITNDGKVSQTKLSTYTKNNPGIFIWDPSLRSKTANAKKLTQEVKKLEGTMKEKFGSGDMSDVMQKLTGSDALGAGLGWALSSSIPGVGWGLAASKAYKAHKHLKAKSYQKTVKKAREAD